MSKNKKETFDTEETLIKRTLMVSAYPALIKSVEKDGETLYNGFLPGFSTRVEDLEDEDECVEYLQDLLDDEVENLVCEGKSLPFVEEDDELIKKYPNHKIVYLDINVYATKEELDYYDSCAGDCESCAHKCGEEEYYDDCDCCDCEEDDDCDCEDDDCCGDDCEDEHCSCNNNNTNLDSCNHNKNHESCNCNHDKDHKDCECGNHNKEHKDCKCGEDKNKKICNCNSERKHDNCKCSNNKGKNNKKTKSEK